MSAHLVGIEREAILVDVAEGVCTITLDRPQAANSRNQAMRRELLDAWSVIAADESIRAVVLTGAGDRFFCAGMDVKEAGNPETAEARRTRLAQARDIEVLATLPQPTIAAVNGYAMGGGFEMALACDIRLCSETAQFGLPEVTVGLVPGGGGTQRLPRMLGLARAAELILLGRRLTAQRALELGLVSETTEPGALATRAHEIASELAAREPAAVRSAKSLLRLSAEQPLSTGVAAELDALCDLLDMRSPK